MKILKKALLVLLCSGIAVIASAQTVVRGVVTDNNGEPLMGAGVFVTGTTNGVVTDFDGNYEITLSEGATQLTFSMIGMAEQTVSVDGRSKIDVVMGEDTTFLDEVVVVGYATVKRRDLLGSVSSVNSEKLTEQPVTTVSQALTGKMAGVTVTTTEGDPDADIKIRVRGGGSITQDSSPLYIVDGFPVESINDIASSEIQSIDVLKDAFSTAIYGSRGANGVVIVTTKGADKGDKVSVKVNSYYGFKTMANKNAIVPMDSENFVKFQYELGVLRDNLSTVYNNYFGTFSDIDMYSGLATNDWIDQIFGNTGTTFSADASVSGSGKSYNWTLGFAHLDENAIMKGSDYARNNLNFKGQFKTSENTKVDVNVRYAQVDVRGAGANSLNDNSGSNSSNGRLKHAVIFTPIPVSSTSANVDDEEENYGDAVNPLLAVKDNDSKRVRTTLNANAAFSWDIIDNLKLKVDGGFQDYRQTDNRFYGMSTYTVYNFNGSGPVVKYNDVFRRRYRNTNTLQYNFKDLIKNDDHSVDVLLGQETTITKSNTVTMQSRDLPSFYDAELAWNFFSQGTPNEVTNYYNPDDKLVSFFLRANYDYKHKYSFGATLRADGSSKFSEGNRWGFFPSAAASWTISNEEFMESTHGWLDQLKLRYSFGTAGNNNIPSGQLLKTYKANSITSSANYYISTGDTFLTAGAVMNNPDLTWETTYTHNIGIDFSVLSGKLNGSFEVYQNDTKDLLIDFPISGVGYTSQYQNIGSTRNRGFEITLNAPIITKKDFSLNVSGNISFNKNEVTSLGGLDEIPAGSGWAGTEITTDYKVTVHQALGNMVGYISDGFYTTDDMTYNGTKWVANDGVASNVSLVGENYFRPGAPKYKDFDDDGVITASDMKVIGNALPDWQGGFSLSGYFKGFDFSANFNYMIGNDVYNANRIEFNSSRKFPTLRNLTNTMDVDNRWSNIDWTTGEIVNDAATLNAMNEGKTMWAPFIQNAVLTDWAIEDGSFLRLQSVTLGYTIPETLTQRFHISKLRLYATGTNLFCLTGYSGYDPEVDTRRSTPLTPGVDCSAYPKSIGCVFGVNLTF